MQFSLVISLVDLSNTSIRSQLFVNSIMEESCYAIHYCLIFDSPNDEDIRAKFEIKTLFKRLNILSVVLVTCARPSLSVALTESA